MRTSRLCGLIVFLFGALLASFEELIKGFGGAIVELEELNPDAADLFPSVPGVPNDFGAARHQLITCGTPETEVKLLSDVEQIGCVQEHSRARYVLGVGSDLTIAAADPDAQTGHQPDRRSGPHVDHLDDRLAETVWIVDRNNPVDSAPDIGFGFLETVRGRQNYQSGIPAGAVPGSNRLHEVLEWMVSQRKGCNDTVVSTTFHCGN